MELGKCCNAQVWNWASAAAYSVLALPAATLEACLPLLAERTSLVFEELPKKNLWTFPSKVEKSKNTRRKRKVFCCFFNILHTKQEKTFLGEN